MWLTCWHVKEIMYYKEFSTLPANIKLATGGADLIRGFDYQSIGFGDKLFEASLEARYLINFMSVLSLMLVWPAWNVHKAQTVSGFGMGYDFGETSIGLDMAYPEHNSDHTNYI